MMQSTLSVEPVSSRSLLARSRAWISILLLTPVTILASFSMPHFATGSWGSVGCTCIGWLLFLSGALFRWWATIYIGGCKDRQLATQGAYSVTRNPLYFGTFLMCLAIGAVAQNLTLILVTILVSCFYLMVTVSDEERRLSLLHGHQFDDYCARVPRFLPRFELLATHAVVEVRVKGLIAEFKRMLRWATIPILCEIVLHLRTLPWWPHYIQLP